MNAVSVTRTAPPRSRSGAWLLGAVGLLAVLSFVRVVSGQDQLTSSGTFGAALVLAVPIALAGLGGLFAERAGVVNIGLEGMMILGTWFAGWAGYQWGPWAALVAGTAGGALGGLLHALATVTFGVDHIVSGVAINILAPGLTRFLSEVLFTGESGGGATQSPTFSQQAPKVSLPVLSSGPDLLGGLERTGIFLLADLAGLLRGLTHEVGVLTVLAALSLPLSWYLLWRTPFGLRLRSCGENPHAADSLGVPVHRMKYLAVVISGALAGLGGVFLVFVSNGYREGQTTGRGFIGLAAMIFGNWRPGGLALGSALFGFADGLQLRSSAAVVALLLLAAVLLAGYAGYAFWRGGVLGGVVGLGAAVAFAVLWLVVDEIPESFVFFTPHVVTLLVLSVAAQRLRMPAADGKPYRRGEEA
ncbi:ABC transporter permease [Carbonactinospora thermoautotrophica]|uniref:ABC transporter permease n=1 Tax=Carbonactinospora thermoautotrophica TaxID=1469144 RepID=A0A132N0S8_9ACTN|nr:ABC transporter permease [Carbonactinospora thermoautotrophica]KWX02469.1 putative sugar ABC transporter integral membrane protein [Carbonactinospora thermoautotrophica]KWX03586.1 ABC transporter permease [Carbonactinospora thermoautotrophica]KWX08907.1 ABC transporter permease [Carbonactinospora thermoautotrophica]